MTLPLTAELCARAVIASARFFGDDPAAVLMMKPVPGSRSRRSISPAALAILSATACRRDWLCRTLNIDYFGLQNVLKRKGAEDARDAALKAIGWPAGPQAAVAEPAPVRGHRTPPPTPPALSVLKEIDYRPAIRAALERRRAKGLETAAPADDQPERRPDPVCKWPLGDGADMRSCGEVVVSGRPYCAAHCRKAGLKPTPREIAIVGRTALPFGARDLGAG
ncbi:hypothetical protein GVN24_24645 [Rhizobium sp. CRIBSB]|nr:hypothetical protein [Rhizobium sp. CRIBSB]